MMIVDDAIKSYPILQRRREEYDDSIPAETWKGKV